MLNEKAIRAELGQVLACNEQEITAGMLALSEVHGAQARLRERIKECERGNRDENRAELIVVREALSKLNGLEDSLFEGIEALRVKQRNLTDKLAELDALPPE